MDYVYCAVHCKSLCSRVFCLGSFYCDFIRQLEILSDAKVGNLVKAMEWAVPGVSGKLRLPDSRHMKVVSLSDLYTGCLCVPESIPGTNF